MQSEMSGRWMMFGRESSPARKRYQRDVIRLMVLYAVVVLGSSWVLRHDGAMGFFLYFWSVLPAVPVVCVMVRMGRYLQEEKDEYQRLLAMQAILVGTAALLGTLVVNDFLRDFAHTQALSPFVGFMIFCVGTAITPLVQSLRDRVPDHD